MAGLVLETLSNRKLSIIVSIIVCILFISFLIGGIFAPAPSATEQVLGTKCVPDNPNEISIPRYKFKPTIERKNCQPVYNKSSDLVFAFQLPLPRDGIELDFSRWMTNLLTLMIPEFHYDPDVGISNGHKARQDEPEYINGTVVLKVTLAVKNIGDTEWKLYKSKDRLERHISCVLPADKKFKEQAFDCEMIQLFDLQSLYYDYYLVNIKFLDGKEGLSQMHATLTDVNLVAIHQNGGFTKVWLSMKIFYFAVTLAVLIWYWKRISLLGRKKTLLETTLLLLGIALTQLNAPLELISLFVDFPFSNFLSDIRQCILHCFLVSFWTIFTGEHLMDGVSRSKVSAYYKPLSIILVTFISLLLFDSIQRGIQGYDPFFSIWDSNSHLAQIFLFIALVSAVTYFIYLCYQVYLVWLAFSVRHNSLPSMSLARRLIYTGVVFRFKFLLMATLLCAAFTAIGFLVPDPMMQWDFDGDHRSYLLDLQWTSGILSCLYAMWNCYVIALLCLYAPSHKNLHQNSEMDLDLLSEQSEFSRLTEGDASIKTTTASRSINPPQVFESEMQLLHDLSTKQAFD